MQPHYSVGTGPGLSAAEDRSRSLQWCVPMSIPVHRHHHKHICFYSAVESHIHLDPAQLEHKQLLSQHCAALSCKYNEPLVCRDL